MRGSSFAGSLVFALVAALGAFPWLLVVGPLVGGPWAAALYALLASVLAVVVIAPTWRGAFVGGLGAAILAAALGTLSPTPAVMTAGAVLVLALLRGGFLFGARPLRTMSSRIWALELVLTGGGLVFARLLYEPSAAGVALAIWGYLLVQSLFFLVGGIEKRRSAEGPRPDAFDEARRQALEILEAPRA